MATKRARKVDPDAVQVTHNAAKKDKGTVKNPAHAGDRDATDARFWDVPLAAGGNAAYNENAAPAQVHDRIYRWACDLRRGWRPLAMLDRAHDVMFENRVRRELGLTRPALEGLDLDGYLEQVLFFSRSIVETFQSRMLRRRPAPQFKIEDCEWSFRQRAHNAQTWLDGKLDVEKFGSVYAMMIRDGEVRGDGVTVVDEDDDDVYMERAHRREFLIDPYEARHGADAVRTMYRVRPVSRDSLIAKFPRFKAQIMAAPPSTMAIDEVSTSDMNVDAAFLGRRDLVDFIEAWHLRCDERCDDDDLDKMDGRHAGILDGVTLWYKPWTTPRFPIARLTRHQPMEGFWGYGDIEILRNAQSIIDQMVSDIEQNLAVTGKGVWITPPGVSPDQLVGYRPFQLIAPAGGGNKMEFYHPQPVGAGAIDLLERLIAKMHDLTGAAQWSTQGRSPLGAGASGAAIDTMEDLLSDRHSVFEQSCAQFVCDVAQLHIDAARRIAKRLKAGGQKNSKKPGAWLDQHGLHAVDWDADEIKHESYRLYCEPVSTMPRTRAGKLAWVAEMLAHGFLPSSVALGLVDEPDIKHHTRVFLATLRNCERMMEELANEAKPIPTPEEFHDLTMLLQYARAYYNLAQASRPPAPEEVQDRYRQFMDAVTTILDDQAAKAAQQQGQPGATPAPGENPAGAAATWHGVPISRIPELAAKRAARMANVPSTSNVLSQRGLLPPTPPPDAGMVPAPDGAPQ